MSGIGAQRTIQQIEAPPDILHHRLKTARTSHFQASVELTFQPDVPDHLMFAVVLLHQISPPRGVQRFLLPDVLPKVNHTRSKLGLKIDRVQLQFVDFDKHGTSAPPTDTAQAAEVRTETKVSQGAILKDKGGGKGCQGRWRKARAFPHRP